MKVFLFSIHALDISSFSWIRVNSASVNTWGFQSSAIDAGISFKKIEVKFLIFQAVEEK